MAESLSPVFLTGAAILGLVVLQAVRKLFAAPSPLDVIPSVGIPSYPFGFYVGAWNYIKNGRAITEEGYLKYPGKAFKVALANRWLVVVPGRTLIEDVRKAPDEFLSVAEATNSLLHLEHTIGHEQHHDPFQIAVIRSAMTRNIGAGFHNIRNEIVAAFEDLVPAKTDEWISVPAMQTILPIVSRVSNRFFIGLQCRDPEYIKLTTQYAQDVTSNAAWLHVTPAILRPFATRFFGHLEPATRKALKYLGPLLQHRLDMDDKYGAEWPNDDRPNDMISWLLDEARGYPNRRNVRNLTRSILNVNFGALHTTTQGVLHALYTLAANLQYVQPLREEVESVLRTEGWSKAGIQKLVKLDSFLKESARFVPGGAVAVLRQVMKDFTFSDGTTVPAGALIGIPILSEHHDETNYTNAGVFDGFRFSRMREQAGEGIKHQMVTPTPDYLSFGLGRHACPGRFFAVNEQKMLLAHILMTYDFKLKDGKRPEDEWMAMVGAANSTAEVMFRRRQ
ncbi:cytochrome P450 [Mycena albidolilacea]|uniref:Cytochrome P450 n=1 Tax=Mycena albidolilacea TaxID=1033008 RepID=A0AAD7AI90_9AGAR|nr:cytochrome P450 [Mycena albidolilacea]